MSRPDDPTWYHPGDIVATLRDGDRSPRATPLKIAVTLSEHELDAPRDRIDELVESALERIKTDGDEEGPSLDDPRPLEPRFVDVDDVEYLDTQEFATALGVVLSRYDGSFTTPERVDEVAVDLFWNRQYTTMAFRTIPRPAEDPVDEAEVNAIVRGNTSPAAGRSPSIVGIVSTGGFTEGARELADESDIRLFGTRHLRRWFADAKLTPDILGTIIEREDIDPDELRELVSTLPTLPERLRGRDPLDRPPGNTWSGPVEEDALQVRVERPPSDPEETPAPGEKGTLYADPQGDGDADAFDRFMEGLQDDE